MTAVSHRGGPAPLGKGRISRLGLVLCLGLPLGLSLWWLTTRQPPVATRFDDALDRALVPVMEQLEVQHKLGAATSTQARLLTRELARRSVPFLAPRDLELWAETRQQVGRRSPAVCARLWKGGDDAAVSAAIAELGPDQLDAYAAMLARGFALRLERKPPPGVPAGSIERGFAAVAATLPPEARPAFERDIHRADVSDARACELFLMLSAGARRLDAPLRTDFYRALSAQLTGPG